MAHRVRVVILAALLLGAACSDVDGTGERTGPSGTTTASPTVTGTSPDAGRSDRAPQADRRCQERQGKALENLDWRMKQTADRVSAALTGEAPGASLSLAHHLRTAKETLGADCGRLPGPARRFLRTGLRMTVAPLDQAEYARLLDAFEPWAARHWGAKRAGSLRRSLDACRRYKSEVSAGYAVWWEHTPDGRDWWIQITVDNGTPDELLVTLGGSVWADGVPARYRDPYGPDKHWGRPAEQYSWGGSSADEAYVPAGQLTRRFVGIGEFYKVHLTREGEFFDVRPEVKVGPPSGGLNAWCALPVPRVN